MGSPGGAPGLQVRAAAASDLPAINACYNHYIRETPATFDIDPFTLDAKREWFARYADHGPYRVFVAEAGGVFRGFAYSSPFRPKAAYAGSVETSVYCAPDALGRGVGSALYAALLAALAAEPVHQAVALITLPNDVSEALHRRFGYAHRGVLPEIGRKLGRDWDVAVYQRSFAPGS